MVRRPAPPAALDPDSYLAPTAEGSAEVRDRGSRFLGIILPVAHPLAARAALDSLRRRYPDATHHCWAWRLGAPPSERSADDGEPAGTAGAPILQALRTAGLCDTLAVVARWFGGTKLGKGGLIRAYAAAARAALAATPTALHTLTEDLCIATPLERAGAVKRLLRPSQVELVSETYGGQALFVLRVARAGAPALRAALRALGVAVP